MLKICRKCQVEKPYADFSRHPSTKDKLQSACKKCDNIRRNKMVQETKAKYIKNPLELQHKKCATCHVTKNVNSFSYCKSHRDGFQSSCNECRKELAKQERLNNKLLDKEPIYNKRCSYCKELKDITKFTSAPTSKDGYQHFCRQCDTVRRFKISPQFYQEMLIEQDYKCKICRIEFSFDNDRKTTPNIDHCHTTNVIRGLLCGTCNGGLGMFKDNIDFLQSAIIYLSGFKF